MKLNSFIHRLSTQVIFLFQEKRCVLCHTPFHAKQHSAKNSIKNSLQEILVRKEQNDNSLRSVLIPREISKKSLKNISIPKEDSDDSRQNIPISKGLSNNPLQSILTLDEENDSSRQNISIPNEESQNSRQKVSITEEESQNRKTTSENERNMQQLIHLATQHVHKNVCPDCAKEIKIQTKGFCPACGELFMDENLSGILCANCSKEKPPWDTFLFLGIYQTSLRELLLKAKFNNSTSCLNFLGKFLAHFWLINLHVQAIQRNSKIEYPESIIPMPLHPRRLKKRGYNQCNELAKIFIKECNHIFSKLKIEKPHIPIDYVTLSRTHFKHPQSILSRKERRFNVKNGFIATKMINKHVLIIDDIATTNSTIGEASSVIKKAGASRIDVIVLAKASMFNHK